MDVSTMFFMAGAQSMGFRMFFTVLAEDATQLVLCTSAFLHVFFQKVIAPDAGVVAVSGSLPPPPPKNTTSLLLLPLAAVYRTWVHG
jgi:hypothetical protein